MPHLLANSYSKKDKAGKIIKSHVSTAWIGGQYVINDKEWFVSISTIE